MGITQPVLQALVQQLIQAPLRVNQRGLPGEYVVEVENEEQKRMLMIQNGRALQNHDIFLVDPIPDVPTYQECLKIILTKVDEDEDLGDTRRVGVYRRTIPPRGVSTLGGWQDRAP